MNKPTVKERPKKETSGPKTGVGKPHQASPPALTASDRRLEDIIEFLPDAMFVIDEAGRVIAWNRACEVMTGVEKDAVLGRGDRAYSVPFTGEKRPLLIDLLDMPAPEVEILYKYVQRVGDTIYGESFMPRLRGGRGAHLWGSAAPLFDRAGRRCGAIEIIRDVTTQKAAERSLRESEHKYRELVENANSIILHWSPDGRILFMNEYGQRFFGYSEAELSGRYVIGTIVPATDSGRRDLRRVLAEIGRDPSAFEMDINESVRRNGDRVWVAWTNKVVLDEDGRPQQILSIGSDITARKQAEDELRAIKADLERRVAERTAELVVAKERAEESDRLKSAFLATMSHELRTPLNSVIGFTGLLLQKLAGPLNEEQVKQLGMVRSSGQHLLALINDVLDISKIEAGQIEIHCEPFDLSESIEKVVGTVRPLAEKSGLRLESAETIGLGLITSDRRRVEQVLLNLMSNAIKFTRSGGVSIAGSRSGGRVTIKVIDSGIGIKPEDLGALFRPFRQIDSGLTRQFEGTGLGLAICKRLVEKLGGDITVESRWGEGSTFQVVLPVETKEAA